MILDWADTIMMINSKEKSRAHYFWMIQIKGYHRSYIGRFRKVFMESSKRKSIREKEKAKKQETE